MDVLELDEAPAQAVGRMEDTLRRAKGQRRGPTEHPSYGPYVPDALGDRGLLGPVVVEAPELPRDFDRHDGRGKDHDRDHDRDPGKDPGKDKDRGGPGGG